MVIDAELCIISSAFDVPKRIFAVLYVSIMGLTRCYKTTVFVHLYLHKTWTVNTYEETVIKF